MKSLKELLEIKNQKHLNESFKSSILKSITNTFDNYVSINVLISFFSSKDIPGHFDSIINMLCEDVANVFKKYLNADDSKREEYKQDIIKVFSVENINAKEDEYFKEVLKQISSKNDLNIDYLNDLDFNKGYKKDIINAFALKYNSKAEDDPTRKMAKFNLSNITDDMFDVYSTKDIESVKGGMSPVIVTNLDDEVVGITQAHNILFYIDPYTMLHPNESYPCSLIYDKDSFIRHFENWFPLKMRIDAPDINDKKLFDEFQFKYADNLNDKILSAYSFFYKDTGMLNKERSEKFIQIVEDFKNEKISSINSYISEQGAYYYTPKEAISTFVKYVLNPFASYYSIATKYTKVVNPYNFNVCIDMNRSMPKYKDYINEIKNYGIGNVYVLNKNLYKEKLDKTSGIYEPVNKDIIDTEKFEKRKEWLDFCNKNRNVALENIKRYNEIIKNNKMSSSSVDMFKEFTDLMVATKNIQKETLNIGAVIGDKLLVTIDRILQEPSAKKLFKDMNSLYSYEDTNDKEYTKEYIERNSYFRRSERVKLENAHKYVFYMLNKTKQIIESVQYYCIDVQKEVIKIAGAVMKINKLPKNQRLSYYALEDYYSKLNRAVTENTYSLETEFQNCYKYWKTISENIKYICFNNDETLYQDFMNIFTNTWNLISDFLKKYGSPQNLQKELSNFYSYIETTKKLNSKEKAVRDQK